MRHLMGVVLAIVLAGVLFFAGAWGYLRLAALTAPLSRLPAGGGSLLSDHGMIAALVAVAGTGLLAGILMVAPRNRSTGSPGMTGDSGYNPGLDQIIGSQAPTETFSHPGQADQAGPAGQYHVGQGPPSGLPRRLPT